MNNYDNYNNKNKNKNVSISEEQEKLEEEFTKAANEISKHTKEKHCYCECGKCYDNRIRLTAIGAEMQSKNMIRRPMY